jgi:hypothetical protein
MMEKSRKNAILSRAAYQLARILDISSNPPALAFFYTFRCAGLFRPFMFSLS